MSWSLPLYESLSETLTASLARASKFEPNRHDDNTPTRVSYNIARKLATQITEKDFILIPIGGLQSEDIFNYEYLESSGFVILILKGLPTETASYATLIGYYQGVIEIDVGANLHFTTPTNFLIASGDLLINCQTVRDAQVKGQQNYSTNKRQRANQEDEQRTTPQAIRNCGEPLRLTNFESEKNNSYIYDPQGGLHPTRIKTDIATREQDLAVSFRVLEPGRWRAIMGPDKILDIVRYKNMLIEQYETRPADREEAYASCGLLDRIKTLSICRDSKQLEKLMKGLFGNSIEGNLGLKDFLCPGSIIPTDLTPCQNNNLMLVVALKNLEIVLRITFASVSENSLSEVVECLEGELRPLDLAPSGFLLYSVEVSLTQFFRKLREPIPKGSINTDLENPIACAKALKGTFKTLIEELSDHIRLNTAITRYTLLNGTKLSCWPSQRIETIATSLIKEVNNKGSTSVCAFFFASQLNVEDTRSGKRINCKHVNCSHTHQKVHGLSKKELLTIANSFHGYIKEKCILAIKDRKDV